MEAYNGYKQSFIKDKDKSKIKNKDNKEESSILLSIDIQIDENNSKKFEINSFDEFDKKLNSFCKENNLTESAKKYIIDSIMKQIHRKKYKKCKNKLII